MTAPLWHWQELCRAVGLDEVAGPDITGISIDSRTIRQGDLFIALAGDPGPRFHTSGSAGRDGHDFVAQAEADGAGGVMVRPGTHTNGPALHVEDTLDGLWTLGQAARARIDGRVAAITGSAGKTTARQWLETILGAQARTHASTGSFNNHWGVPLSLARMPRESAIGVFEVGTNHAGEIEPLSRLVAPDVAIVLNVLPAHIGNFDDLDALRREKLSIEAGLREGGTLIVPDDLDLTGSVSRNIITFGQSRRATVSGSARYRDGGADVTVRIGKRRREYRLGLPGEHRVLTSLAVVGTLFALDVDLDTALADFATVTVPAGRGNPVRIGNTTVIDDSYNANPVSMRFALEALAVEEGCRIAILGEMLELGDGTRAMHAEIEPVCADLDGVITVGAGFEDWGNSLGDRHWAHVESSAELDLEALAARILADGTNATILVKGANKVFWVNQFVDSLSTALAASR